jgi:ABC-type nitrate/sulfonate/bicarbonate transport system permease component
MSTLSVAVPAGPRGALLRWGRLPAWLRYLLLLAAIVGIWQAYWTLSGVNPLLFSGPRDVADAFWTGWRDGTLARTTWTTLRLLAVGIAIGALVAAILTLAPIRSWSPSSRRSSTTSTPPSRTATTSS